MITPNDIATKDFKKVAVGYSPEEVDTFLDDLYEDYEKLYLEHNKKKTEAPVPVAPTPAPTPAPVAQAPERFAGLEKAIERTLTLAEMAAAESKAAAKAEGEQIIHEAKLQAEEILQNARTKSYDIQQDILALENRYELMRTRVKLLLYAEIELLDKNEILGQKETGAEGAKK